MITLMCGSGQHQLVDGLDGLKENTDSEFDMTENGRARGHPKKHVENCEETIWSGVNWPGYDFWNAEHIAHAGSKSAWSHVCNTVGSMQQILADVV